MTRNLQRIGGKALVALMATMMLLSVFAGPAAAETANTVESPEENIIEATATDVADGEIQTEEITIDFGTGADAVPEDEIILQIHGDNVDEGDLEIDEEDTDITNNIDAGEEGESAFDLTVEDRNVYSGTVDTIILDGAEFTGEKTLDLRIGAEIDTDLATDLAAYADSDQIFEFTTDDTHTGPDELTSQDVATLDLVPGPEANALTISNNDEQIAFDDESVEAVSIQAEDSEGNTIVATDTRESDLGDLDTDYESVEDISVELDNAEATFSGDGIELDLADTDSEDGEVDVSVGHGGEVDVDTSSDGDADQSVVGQYDLSADADGVGEATGEFLIEPDAIIAEFGDDFRADADSAESDLEVVIADESEESVEEISQLEFDLTQVSSGEFFRGEDRELDVNFAADVETLNQGEFESIGETTVIDGTLTLRVTDDTRLSAAGAGAATVSTTDSGEYTHTPAINNNDDVTETSDTLTVDPGAATDLAVDFDGAGEDSNEFTFDHEVENIVEYTIVIVDEHGNQADDSDRYAGSDTDLTVSVEDAAHDEYNGTDGATLEGTSAENLVTIGDDSDIDAAVGEDFTLTVEQDSAKLAGEDEDVTVSETFSVYPNGIALEYERTVDDGSVGDAEALSVTLEQEGDDNVVNEVDEFDITYAIADEELQTNLDDPRDVVDVTQAIEDDGGVELANVADDAAAVTVTEAEPDHNFNTTLAGQFQLEASIDLADGTDDDTTDGPSSDTVFFPEEIDAENSVVGVSDDIAGVVDHDGGNVDIPLELRDEFNNIADKNAPSGEIDLSIEIDGEEVFTDESITFGDTEPGLGVDAELPSEITVDTTEIDDTGDATVIIELEEDETFDDDELELVHETIRSDAGDDFEFTSMPQTAELTLNDSVVDVSQYNATEDNYEFVEEEASGFVLESDEVTADTLHKGIVVETDGEALWGYTFEADDAAPREVTLEEDGYHLLGSNFDISADDGDRNIKEELGFRSVNPQHNDDLDEIDEILVRDTAGQALIEDGDDIDDFESYWVRLSDADADENSPGVPEIRTVLDPAYSPSDRDSELNG